MNINQNVISNHNHSWEYKKRIINLNNFTISYETVSGISSKEEAVLMKKKDDEKYLDDLARIKKIGNTQYTFQEFLQFWLDTIFLPDTDTVTSVIGLWTITKHIIPRIKTDILLPYVTPEYINELLLRINMISDSSGNVASKFLRRIFRDAYAYGYIHTDIRPDIMYLPQKQHHLGGLQLYTKQQLSVFLQTASKHPNVYFEILLALFAGLRTGEIRGLRYEDFDPESKVLRIERQYVDSFKVARSDESYSLQKYETEKDPKWSSFRCLKIPDFLFEELEHKKTWNQSIIDRAKEKGDPYDEGYISISVKGTLRKKGTIANPLRRICLEASLPLISMHGLRHEFASLLFEKGIPLEQISKLLGHKSVTTTFDVYCGIIDADSDAKKIIKTFAPYIKKGV